jgi:CubicO group peptidase (beta-lactamase class C family)
MNARRRVVAIGATALAVMGLWAALVIAGTLEGWWHGPIAPPGDAEAFLAAARERIEASTAGNAVVVLLEGGAPRGEIAVSPGDPGASIDRDTVFQVASLSKWVSAWGVLALVEQGRLELDAPIERYLTRWSLPPGDFDPEGVTVRRLLSHTAGLTDDLGYQGFAPEAPVQSLEASLTHAADAQPHASGAVRVGAPPGAGWRYSGGGFTLLQLVVEERSGESFERHMQHAVLQPLGMAHSTYEWTPASGSRLAACFDTDGTAASPRRFTALAAASLYTSASDLVRFLQAHLEGDDGEPPGRGVLSPGTLAAMRKPFGFRIGRGIYGLGTMLYAPGRADEPVIGHDGYNTPAINTAARLDPATGDGIVVLESGDPRLATRLAGEWVLWNTGHVGVMRFWIGLEAAQRTIPAGAVAIALVAAAIAWRGWKRSATRVG